MSFKVFSMVTTKRKLLDPGTWIGNTVVQFPNVKAGRTAQPAKEVDAIVVAEATRVWRAQLLFGCLQRRPEVTFGRPSPERRARILVSCRR